MISYFLNPTAKDKSHYLVDMDAFNLCFTLLIITLIAFNHFTKASSHHLIFPSRLKREPTAFKHPLICYSFSFSCRRKHARKACGTSSFLWRQTQNRDTVLGSQISNTRCSVNKWESVCMHQRFVHRFKNTLEISHHIS